MIDVKKIATNALVDRLKDQTDYKVSKYNKPSTAQMMYNSLESQVSSGVNTLLVSSGILTFTPIDTMGTVLTAIFNIDLFLVANSMLTEQLGDTDRETNKMFFYVAKALTDHEFMIDDVPYNFVLQSLNELFFDDSVDAQQLTIQVQGINIEL